MYVVAHLHDDPVQHLLHWALWRFLWSKISVIPLTLTLMLSSLFQCNICCSVLQAGTCLLKPSFSQVGPKQFDRVLDMVSKVRSMGMEVCTTLGMLTAEQAQKLKVAGLSCYNHNLDTSPEFYPKITSSRNYDDRLDTLEKVTDRYPASLQAHESGAEATHNKIVLNVIFHA